MTASTVSSPWPASAQAASRLGGAATAAGAPAAVAPEVASDAASAGAARTWSLQRNCSLRPKQLAAVYLAICAVTVTIAAGFWLHGATPVVAFAGLELAAVTAALLCYARHAGDREVLTLAEGRLLVERHDGPRVTRSELPAAWTRVETDGPPGALIRLAAPTSAVQVGRHLRPQQRAAFARELRAALRAQARPGPNFSTRPELE